MDLSGKTGVVSTEASHQAQFCTQSFMLTKERFISSQPKEDIKGLQSLFVYCLFLSSVGS